LKEKAQHNVLYDEKKGGNAPRNEGKKASKRGFAYPLSKGKEKERWTKPRFHSEAERAYIGAKRGACRAPGEW